jgi:Toastrack DUF4097
MKLIRYILLVLTLLGVSESYAQELVHKVSKEQSENFDQEIKQVLVWGEKASITVSGWSKDYIQVHLKPISRNVSKKEAISDLKFISYDALVEGNNLVIKNSFKGSNEKISSNLSMEIQIMMPGAIPIEISNLYGPVSAKELSNIKLDVSFGHITLADISGYASLNSRYSNMNISRALGALHIQAEKSDINAEDLDAKTNITSKYGKADIELSASNQSLSMEAYRTEVKISVDAFEDFNYRLSTTHGSINTPGRSSEKKESFQLSHKEKNKDIEISTTYSDITIASKLLPYAKTQQ